MDKQKIIALLIELDGDLSSRIWMQRCHRHATHILQWFDEIEITTRVPVRHVKKRTLSCDVFAAIAIIKDHDYPELKRKKRGWHLDNTFLDTFVVISDPTDLFDPGCSFPALQIKGSCRKEWLKPGELPTGIIMEYRDQRWTMDAEVGLMQL